jgi:hypothetical protein
MPGIVRYSVRLAHVVEILRLGGDDSTSSPV